MTSKSASRRVGEKMSKASDQSRSAPELKPALGENIASLSEDEVKEKVAERMSDPQPSSTGKTGGER